MLSKSAQVVDSAPTPGLTPFLCAMMATPVDRLRKADTAKLAAKYGIRADWAAWYLNMWINR